MKNKIFVGIFSLLFVLSVALNVFLMVNNKNAIFGKDQTEICSKDDIDKFNKIYHSSKDDKSGDIDELKNNLSSRKDHDKDVDCVYMLMSLNRTKCHP